jgi:hypothetical protein
VAGTWTVERAKHVATLTVTAFSRLAAGVRAAIEAEADSMLGFVEPDAGKRAIRI